MKIAYKPGRPPGRPLPAINPPTPVLRSTLPGKVSGTGRFRRIWGVPRPIRIVACQWLGPKDPVTGLYPFKVRAATYMGRANACALFVGANTREEAIAVGTRIFERMRDGANWYRTCSAGYTGLTERWGAIPWEAYD